MRSERIPCTKSAKPVAARVAGEVAQQKNPMQEVRPLSVGFFARKGLRMTKIPSGAPLPLNDKIKIILTVFLFIIGIELQKAFSKFDL